MHRLSIDEIIALIQAGESFEAVSSDYSFTLKIEEYVPFLCGAVHDGHQFRPSLWKNCKHSEYERWYEEDPCTKEMVQTFPIVISGRDSRFEYDLNREPERAVYEDAWGKQLWNEPLSSEEKKLSLQKHANFYRVVHALVQKLEQSFRNVVVFDMHSYNWKRWDREVPVWNLGTSNINQNRFGELTEFWSNKLGTMQLPQGIMSTSKINDTFQGNGYFLKYITKNFDNTLVLATEISKIYCDELSGVIYPEIVRSVEEQLKKLIPEMVTEFEATFR
ncbi:N-formylglutamate amidohydrolase [Flagellimonas meridianipacifica]|uniref:N-formylglutamate amidohydrolase n=1 Tax=Flagellimonas meridianipacifica TaxID=1080225 RepID=A0A2T0MBH8_9FLAO|nr:N-formylglutamate amidohydrolase [Allomuricauda pacifica]PRX54772.1 N-formylglutamate amidohydrolase [Allomuricauda pacifica]